MLVKVVELSQKVLQISVSIFLQLKIVFTGLQDGSLLALLSTTSKTPERATEASVLLPLHLFEFL